MTAGSQVFVGDRIIAHLYASQSKEAEMDIIQMLEYRAQINQNDLAVISRGRSASYSMLLRQVRNIASRLREMGVKPGQIVAVYVDTPYLHIATVLALCHEGATAVSGGATYAPLPDQIQPDAFIADKMIPFMASAPAIMLDSSWLKLSSKTDAKIRPLGYPDRSAPCRLMMSSARRASPRPFL